MIQLQRDRTKVHVSFTGAKRTAQLKKLVAMMKAAPPGTKLPWVQKYWKGSKDQLKVESNGKCAYCEADAASVSHGDVEHIRPKSYYWWLAYCYDNYLFSCQICNQLHKLDNFPADNQIAKVAFANLTDAQATAIFDAMAPDPLTPNLNAFFQSLTDEGAHLPNPYSAEDPETLFKWEADDALKQVEVRPKKNTVRLKKIHAAAVQYLGLNRADLLGKRYIQYQILNAFKAAYDGGGAGKAAAIAGFKAMVQPNYVYTGMNRYFIREKWKLKDENGNAI